MFLDDTVNFNSVRQNGDDRVAIIQLGSQHCLVLFSPVMKS